MTSPEAHLCNRIGRLRAAVLGATADGAPVGRAIGRVTLWRAIVMPATAVIGRLFGAVV